MQDSEIVGLFNDRDERAISEAKSKYGGYCLSVAGNILGDPCDAEECLNDALLAAWNSIPPGSPGNLRTYLGKIARRLAISRLRERTADGSMNTVDPFPETSTTRPGNWL